MLNGTNSKLTSQFEEMKSIYLGYAQVHILFQVIIYINMESAQFFELFKLPGSKLERVGFNAVHNMYKKMN